MGFFDKILQGLGFEGEESDKKEEKTLNTEKVTNQKIETEYQNINNEEKIFTPQKKFENLEDNSSIENLLNSVIQEKNPAQRNTIKVRPNTQTEVETYLGQLKFENNLIMDLSSFNEHDIFRAMDFIAGYCKCLNANIKKLDDHTFLLEIK